jgi:hypothetical protein
MNWRPRIYEQKKSRFHDDYNWRARRPATQRTAQLIWDYIRKSKRDFSAGKIVDATKASRRYVNSYLLAIARAGYIQCTGRGAGIGRPMLYKAIAIAPEDQLAPQLKGGSGGGKGELGKGWKPATPAQQAALFRPKKKKKTPAKSRRRLRSKSRRQR